MRPFANLALRRRRPTRVRSGWETLVGTRRCCVRGPGPSTGYIRYDSEKTLKSEYEAVDVPVPTWLQPLSCEAQDGTTHSVGPVPRAQGNDSAVQLVQRYCLRGRPGTAGFLAFRAGSSRSRWGDSMTASEDETERRENRGFFSTGLALIALGV